MVTVIRQAAQQTEGVTQHTAVNVVVIRVAVQQTEGVTQYTAVDIML